MNIHSIVFVDSDGVLTDGSMFYDKAGDCLRKFNTKDSAGFLILKAAGFYPYLISAENSDITRKRMSKLELDGSVGDVDKLKIAKQVASDLSLDLSNCVHIGDDIGDIALLKSVGIALCPSDAAAYVRKFCDCILETRGGSGVMREAASYLLARKGIDIQDVVANIINNK